MFLGSSVKRSQISEVNYIMTFKVTHPAVLSQYQPFNFCVFAFLAVSLPGSQTITHSLSPRSHWVSPAVIGSRQFGRRFKRRTENNVTHLHRDGCDKSAPPCYKSITDCVWLL